MSRQGEPLLDAPSGHLGQAKENRFQQLFVEVIDQRALHIPNMLIKRTY